MRVIGYLESSFWAMRTAEFGSMLRVAYAHAGELDSFLALSEPPKAKPETMLAKGGEKLAGTRYVEMRDGVAVIDVNGPIAKRMDMFTELCFGGTSTEKLLRDFTVAIENPDVQSIVLNIDSPGGEAFGINELAQAIYDARGKKPIKAYVSGLGCSGAYWIASAAEEIIADKGAFLGSIGVVTAWADDKEFYKSRGIRREVVVSSNAPFKRLDFDNDEHRAELQRELDSLEKVFHKAVARNRKVSVEQVIGDFNKGGVLAGAEAVKAGMADRTGSLEEVIKGLSSKKQRNAAASAGAENGEFNMSFKDDFKAFASKLGFRVEETQQPGDEEAAEPANPANDGQQSNTEQPEGGQEQQEAPATPVGEENADAPAGTDAAAEALRQLQATQEMLFSTEAEAFVESEIKAGRMAPAEKESFTSLYIQAARDDHESPLAEGSRVETLKANQQKRPALGFTREQVNADANELFILGLGGSEKTEMQKAAEAQVDTYVSTVNPSAKKLEVVKG